MPTGKVKWYDADKGFGFLSDDEGGDVFLHANALPEGVTTLKGGTRVEFGIVEGRRGAQALSVTLLEPAPSVSAGKREQSRKKPEELVPLVEDSIACSTASPTRCAAAAAPTRRTATARPGPALPRGPAGVLRCLLARTTPS